MAGVSFCSVECEMGDEDGNERAESRLYRELEYLKYVDCNISTWITNYFELQGDVQKYP